jgi:hypothetical protein
VLARDVSSGTSGCKGASNGAVYRVGDASDGELLVVSDAPLTGAQDWVEGASGGTLLLENSNGPSVGAQDWEWGTSGGAL